VPTPPLTGLAATTGRLPKQLKDAIHHGWRRHLPKFAATYGPGLSASASADPSLEGLSDNPIGEGGQHPNC
jgi:hypothetical protein